MFFLIIIFFLVSLTFLIEWKVRILPIKYFLIITLNIILICVCLSLGVKIGSEIATSSTQLSYSRSLAGIIYELDKSVKKDDMDDLKQKVIIIISNLKNSDYSASKLQKVDYLLEEMSDVNVDLFTSETPRIKP